MNKWRLHHLYVVLRVESIEFPHIRFDVFL